MTDRPNVVFIITDQQRADTIGRLGCPWMITPNLDQLTAAGISFTNAFACGATCISSRAALFTGVYPHNTGVFAFDRWEHLRTWLHEFRDAGYYLANVGKMHHRDAQMAFHERKIVENKSSTLRYDWWNRWLRMHGVSVPERNRTLVDWLHMLNSTTWEHAEDLHSDVFTGNLAVRFIERWDRRTPLFLQIGFPGPHEPYDPPGRFLSMYDGREMPPRIHRDGELAAKPPEQTGLKQHFETHDHEHQISFADAGPENIARMRRHYCANVTAIDEQVGKIMEALETRDMLSDTLVVFTSDHGDCLGDHGLPYKWFMYDCVTRVPLIVRIPAQLAGGDIGAVSSDARSAKPGTVDSGLFSHIDIGPTLLHLAGLPVPSRLDGVSRVRRLGGDLADAPPAVVCEDNYLTMFRTEDVKLVHYAGKGYGELYDLETDPEELTNLFGVPERAATHAQMESQLLNVIARSAYNHGGHKTRKKPDYIQRTDRVIG